MKLARSLRKLEKELEELVHLGTHDSRAMLRNVGWISAGVTVLALGVVAGSKIRNRYKFARRTPYDMYAHSGDRVTEMEFGVGV